MELFSLAFTIFVVLALAAYYAVGAMHGLPPRRAEARLRHLQ